MKGPTINQTWALPVPMRVLVRCEYCKHLRVESSGPHAPHWQNGVLVDCRGMPVGRPS